MKKQLAARRFPVRIELTALVDVVLLLLIFFMVSTRLVPEFGFELSLPQAEHAQEIDETPGAVRVLVDAQDRYYLDGEAVSIQGLKARVSAEDSSHSLLLEADEGASHGAVMRVLDVAKMAGLESVRLAADPPEQGAED